MWNTGYITIFSLFDNLEMYEIYVNNLTVVLHRETSILVYPLPLTRWQSMPHPIWEHWGVLNNMELWVLEEGNISKTLLFH